MKDIRSIHGRAMELMRSANQSLEDRDKVSYLAKTAAALELEREAAFELLTNFESEPTRSVLFRSAAKRQEAERRQEIMVAGATLF